MEINNRYDMKINLGTLYRIILMMVLIAMFLMLYMIYLRNYDTNKKVTYIYETFKEFNFNCIE